MHVPSSFRFVALVLVVLAGWAGQSAAHAAPTAITVLYFDNDSGNATYDYLGKSLADMWITDLSSLPEVRVVEREKLEQLLVPCGRP